jgi:hypothetical protein
MGKAKDKYEAIERQIDQLVYALYGLTEEEIKIITNYELGITNEGK